MVLHLIDNASKKPSRIQLPTSFEEGKNSRLASGPVIPDLGVSSRNDQRRAARLRVREGEIEREGRERAATAITITAVVAFYFRVRRR